MYRNGQHKFNKKIWALLIFSHGHYLPSWVCLFVLRILPYLEFGKCQIFIFNILFRFMLNKMMATALQEVKDQGISKLLSSFVIHIGCEQTTAIITLTFYSE